MGDKMDFITFCLYFVLASIAVPIIISVLGAVLVFILAVFAFIFNKVDGEK